MTEAHRPRLAVARFETAPRFAPGFFKIIQETCSSLQSVTVTQGERITFEVKFEAATVEERDGIEDRLWEELSALI